jgi:Family of unknown function (DUF6496)
MPWDKVMNKWKKGELHSGSKKGKKVTNQKQAVAIMLSEKKAAGAGKKEYQPINTAPSNKVRGKFGKQ